MRFASASNRSSTGKDGVEVAFFGGRLCALAPAGRRRAPGPPRERHLRVAGAAQQAIVLEAAFAAALRDRDDVIRLPARPGGAPLLPGSTIRRRRLPASPFAVRLRDVQPAELTDPLVALPDFAAHVPRAAAYLPLVHAGFAAESAPRRQHRVPAPAADWLASLVAVGFAPLVGCDDTGSPRAHAAGIGVERREGYSRASCATCNTFNSF